MKDEQIRIAVAELRGIKDYGYRKGMFRFSDGKGNNFNHPSELPDYLNDANECVKLLEELLSKYLFAVYFVIESSEWSMYLDNKGTAYHAVGTFCRAVCELYLKVNNKWKEDND